MFKPNNWIYGIMVIVLVGIFALHTYFAYQDIRVKTYEFQQQVNLSFEEAVASEKKARIDSFILFARTLFSDTSKIEILANYNEEKERTQYSVKDKEAKEPHTTVSYKDDKRVLNYLDSVDREITIDRFMESVRASMEWGSVYYWTPSLGERMVHFVDSTFCNEKTLAAFFRKNLDEREISANFHFEKIASEQGKAEHIPESDFQTTAFSTEFPGRKTRKAVAIIHAPSKEILRRAKLSILGSGFNFLLIAFSFFLMLRIILKQKKVSQIKDDLIDNITHELQTPLATLMAANEGLTKYHALEDPEKCERYLSISKMELERLSKMVDDILMRSIHNKEGLIIYREKLNVADLISVCAGKQQLKTKENVQFILNFQDPDIQIKTDKMHLYNILGNLIENAIKYNNASQKIIKIETKQNQNDLEIFVSDNGLGIPKKLKDKVFDKFFRNPTIVSSVKGFGIGLYYVKNILNKLDGRIYIEPGRKKGTSFCITLPLNIYEA